jgi:hypothetical protein
LSMPHSSPLLQSRGMQGFTPVGQSHSIKILLYKQNSVAFSPQVNYNDWATTAAGLRNLVSTFADRGVSRGQRGGSPTVVNLSFLDRSCYFSFK